MTRHRLLEGGFLVVATRREPRAVLENLVRWEGLGPVKFVVAVSEDVDLADEANLLWGIFTRFDPARDIIMTEQEFIGARPVYRGRVGHRRHLEGGVSPPPGDGSRDRPPGRPPLGRILPSRLQLVGDRYLRNSLPNTLLVPTTPSNAWASSFIEA